MSGEDASFRTPFTRSPGSSTPSPEVTPAEGRSELHSFVLLSLLSTAIIAVAGCAAYWFVV